MKKIISLFTSIILTITLLSAFSASATFIPSPFPGGVNVVHQESNGENYKALIVNGSSWNSILMGVPDGNIIVTSYQDIDKAPAEVDKVAFEKAKKELESASSLKDINSKLDSDAVLKDFFDITVTGIYKDEIAKGNNLKVTFKIGDLNGDFKVIVRGKDGWKVVENVRVNNDGTATVLFDEIGPVAFIVDPDGSPETSDSTPVFGFIIIALFSLACIILLFVKGKSKVQ